MLQLDKKQPNPTKQAKKTVN